MFNEGCVASSEYIFVYREESTGHIGFAQAPNYDIAKILQATLFQHGLMELGNKWRFQDVHLAARPDKPIKEVVWN